MTDKALIRLLIRDPETGLRETLKLFGGPVKTICKNILDGFSKEDVEEAVSDSFTAIWKSAGHFREESGSSFKSYCYGIARHTALQKRKELMRSGPLIPFDEDLLEENPKGTAETVSSLAERREEEHMLHEVLGSLTEPERSIFIFRYFYFFKVKEIALRLQLTDKNVENCLYRGRQKLKEQLTKRGIDR